MKQLLSIVYLRCAGDCLVLEMAIHSLHQTYPEEYDTILLTPHPAIYKNNPYSKNITSGDSLYCFIDNHPHINSGLQFGEIFCKEISECIKRPFSLTCSAPHLYLTEEEKQPFPNLPEKYIVINNGWKPDTETKYFPHYQKVVDALHKEISFVQVGSSTGHHPLLNNVIDYRDKTDIRQLIRLCYCSTLGLGGMTFATHIYRALNKPYVCVAGGREPKSLNPYPNMLYGECEYSPCWALLCKDNPEQEAQLTPENPYPVYCKNVCGEWAKCMSEIKPETIINKIWQLLA